MIESSQSAMKELLRYTLDLFAPDNAPSQAHSSTPDNGHAKVLEPGHAPPAIKHTPVPALATQTFAHPNGAREARLGHALVRYQLKRGRRRTIGFVVGAEGLTVSAPRWAPLYEVDKAVQEKSSWILKKLGEAREREARDESARVEWRDGGVIPFLGESVIVVLDPRQTTNGTALLNAGNPASDAVLPGVAHLTLHVGLPHDAAPERIRDAVVAWLMRQAKRVFEERLNHFAPRLGVQWRKLSLSSASTRWGSASADGAIRLNWRLIHMRMSVIDYVVAHELAHLRVMDHSPRFWSTIESVMPDYQQLRSVLRDNAVPRL